VFARGSSPDFKRPEVAPNRAATDQSATQNSGQYASIIGPDLTVTGEQITVFCKNTLLIAGEIAGDVNGDEVTVAKTGKVTGTISARTIAVHGRVNGSLRATTATLHSTAQVSGDILQQNLVIAEGAQFDGRVRVASDPSEVQPQLDPSAATHAETVY